VHETNDLGCTVISYNDIGPQAVNIFDGDSYEKSPAYCNLPDDGSVTKNISGTSVVGVGAYDNNAKHAVSNSFGSCVPIVAFYDDSTIGLYHANSAQSPDVGRAELLSRNPTDVYLLTKPGVGASKSYMGSGVRLRQQTLQALDWHHEKSEECRYHIVEVLRKTLAVEVTAQKLNIYYQA
jgi:hypothetical protein